MYEVEVMGMNDPPRTFGSVGEMFTWMQVYCNQHNNQVSSFLVTQKGLEMNSSPVVESLVANRTKTDIELDLEAIAPEVHVVGSRLLEDGYELVLEGPSGQIADLAYFWNQYA